MTPTGLPSVPVPPCGCPDYESSSVSRRHLMRLATAAGLVTATTLSDARVAFAAPAATSGDVLVVLSLRGGFDGLSAVAPIGDPGYARARPGIAVPAATAKKVDATFGLHPALAPLFPLWDDGTLAAVHAVGQKDPTRSHFEAMAQMERAAPGTSLRDGWIDRTVGLSAAASAFTAAQVGSPALPSSLLGDAPKMAIGSLAGLKVDVDPELVPMSAWRNAFDHLHAGTRAEIRDPLHNAMDAVSRIQALPEAGDVGALGYPDNQLGNAFHDVARLVRADLGLRYATVDYGNWDMHENVGGVDGGWMTNQLGDLAKTLAAFAAELGPDLGRVTVVTLSEFGRRVGQNGSYGLDHGHGNAVLLLGGGVRGGRVYGRWPGLSPANLDAGDLAATTDYRDVIGEILTKRCGVGSLTKVFPGLAHRPLGLAAATA
ncbi:MAG: DUF1501 domain-containing protein [Kineosporiaceae bacterium]